MMSNWTPEQEAAITTRGCNLLVSAAAGAGKTAVLVERIIRRLVDNQEPLDISRLLVVTFTNAAAQEMKDRIAEALTKRIRENPEDRNLKRQLLLLGKASISTLHAFCLELIRQNYYRLSLPYGLALDPRFRIADEIETTLIRIETLQVLFEEKYTAEDALFLELVDGFGGERDDQTLSDLVLKLHEFSRSHPYPGAWLDEVARTFRANLGDEAIQKLFQNVTESITAPLHEALDLLLEAKELASCPGGPAVYADNLQEEIAQLNKALAGCYEDMPDGAKTDWLLLTEELRHINFRALKTCRDKEVDEQLKKEAQNLRNSAKKIIQRLQKEFLSRTHDEYVADMQHMAPLMEALCRLTEEFEEQYLKEKLRRNILDFSDIEHFALNLLQDERIAGSIGCRYEEVLIDEYQDINNVQETILARVANSIGIASSTGIAGSTGVSGKMFMVGDVKQSIYGFRLADPGLFLGKYNSFGKNDDSCERKIVLAKNFRSRQVVIDAVNFIFRQVMGTTLGGIVYDSDAELVCGSEYPAEPPQEGCGPVARAVEVYVLERDGEGGAGISTDNAGGKETAEVRDEAEENESSASQGTEDEDLDSAQLEARVIGSRIQELLGSAVWDKEKREYRPARYKDIVVLMRSTKGTALTFTDEFRQLGIPVYSETGTGYLGAEEVQTMLALLKIIDNPRQDIPLVAALRSAIVGLTAAELTSVRLCRTKGDFYDALRAAAWKERKAQQRKLREFLLKLQRWRTYARRNSVAELVWLLFRETGYYDYAGALTEGKQKQANLRALHDRAKQYENTTMKGLFKFLRFLEKIEDTGSDLGAARALGEKEDVVRVMSIHKSKGLEFPIVFLAGLGRKFNQKDLSEDILLDKELGLGPVWVDAQKRLKYPTLARIAVRNKQKRELLAEEARILYVGMTRARESLILVGTVRNLQKKANSWRKASKEGHWALSPHVTSRAVCYYDWLGPCLLRHRDGQFLAKRFLPLSRRNGQTAENAINQDSSSWQIYLWTQNDIREYAGKLRQDYTHELSRVRSLLPVAESETAAEKEGPSANASGDIKILINKRLGWAYAFPALADIPAKLSVTEIKNRYQQFAQDDLSSQSFSQTFNVASPFARRPLFLQEEHGLSAGEKGSALHVVMRHLKLAQQLNEGTLHEQIEELVTREIITREQGDSVPTAAIAGFFRSGLGARLKNSSEVLREVPFTLALEANELYGGAQDLSHEKIIIQGTIDCLFASEGGYVLVDYKTDRIKPEAGDVLKERYNVQMKLYARAVETILRKPVLEKYLYSFYLGEAVKL